MASTVPGLAQAPIPRAGILQDKGPDPSQADHTAGPLLPERAAAACFLPRVAAPACLLGLFLALTCLNSQG